MKSDSQLQQAVKEELTWEPAVHDAKIGVDVTDGVVTLTGEVPDRVEQWNAERAAHRVSGVKALIVETEVKRAEPGKGDDADIARHAENILSWTRTLPPGAVTVSVDAGWVTLSGTVEWPWQRQQATDNLSHLLGVKGISNRVTIGQADAKGASEGL